MRLLKVLILVLMLSSTVAPVMAADPIKAGEEMISGSIKAFFMDGADSLFTVAPSNSTDVETPDAYSMAVDGVNQKYGANVGSVYTVAAYEHDPYDSSVVQEMRKRTAIIGVFIFILYIFYGAACVNLSCDGMGFIDRVQYIVSDTPMGEYKNTLIRTFAAIFFTHYIFKFIILFNQAVTNQAMYSALDSIQFTQDHWVMYCMMSVCYAAESIFFAMRMLFMDLLAGSDILIGALFAFSFSRSMALENIKYFGRITLLQFTLVLLTAFGIAIINETPQWLQIPGYTALTIVIFVISGIIMMGFSKMFKTAKNVMRMV